MSRIITSYCHRGMTPTIKPDGSMGIPPLIGQIVRRSIIENIEKSAGVEAGEGGVFDDESLNAHVKRLYDDCIERLERDD